MKTHFSHIIIGLIAALAMTGCRHQACKPGSQDTAGAEENLCLPPADGQGHLYESWNADNSLLHIYHNGLNIDVGSHESAKYLERKTATPWVDPEFISAETAKEDALGWAAGRYVRWLAAPSATIHFPFYDEEWDGELSVSVELRPKINPSMAVRFYKPDGNGGRVWSDPLTTDLSPGWYGYRWRVPREYMSKDGMQLMRVSFPGTYFEGENRVSSKFVRIQFGVTDKNTGKYKLEKDTMPNLFMTGRVLDQPMESYGLRTDNRLERFMVIPENAVLRFYAAPGAWMDNPGKLMVEIMTDNDNPEEKRRTLAEISLKPGDCWMLQNIDLSEYAHQAVRLMMYYIEDESEVVFSKSRDFHPDVYISEPEIRIDDSGAYQNAESIFKQAKRIVVIAVDNLRADRIWVESKRRGSTVLSKMADDGLTGVMMGEGVSFVSTATSFLTSVPADVHKVYSPGTHVREMLTTFAEAASEQGWQSHFYSTSASIDSTRGFAQGFDVIYQLNKENVYDAQGALDMVAASLADSEEKNMYYVHLSELRLPHRASDEKMQEWGVPGYQGPVDLAAMQNIAVMREPTAIDARQFEAYYDAELSSVDDAIGSFLERIPENTLVVVYGTHGCSLGESTLGYEQGLTPWELLTPFIFYMPGQQVGIRRDGIARASELSISILDLIGADIPAGSKTIFELHDSRPTAQTEGLTATASMNDFYRIRREAVDILFTTGLDGNLAHENKSPAPITRQALREKID